ncbi:hypothetical protein AcV5_008612 [Taiwanofungus camphoratus]|nr:hypothetical protein AcV5_008612 [Antrodia cinnamomea]
MDFTETSDDLRMLLVKQGPHIPTLEPTQPLPTLQVYESTATFPEISSAIQPLIQPTYIYRHTTTREGNGHEEIQQEKHGTYHRTAKSNSLWIQMDHAVRNKTVGASRSCYTAGDYFVHILNRCSRSQEDSSGLHGRAAESLPNIVHLLYPAETVQ